MEPDKSEYQKMSAWYYMKTNRKKKQAKKLKEKSMQDLTSILV